MAIGGCLEAVLTLRSGRRKTRLRRAHDGQTAGA